VSTQGAPEAMETKKKGKSVQTQIKNRDLVVKRRRQIIDAAVRLFIEKGFHKTTTRQIAAAAGLPIGSMYEYVASKEDILYLVCDAIHAEVEKGVIEAMARASKGKNILAGALREYFLVCDRMSDHILLIYQETQSLPRQWRRKVLENEVRITGIFITLIKMLISSGDLPPRGDSAVEVAAHNIAVLGHMWTFRRWFFTRHYSIEDYIKLQTEFILGLYTMKEKK
jgi:AcrR family transcriptional regulator